MNPVYSSSETLEFINQLNFVAYQIYPVIVFISAAIWLFKSRSKTAVIALIGAILVLSAKTLHVEFTEFQFDQIPASGQDFLIWFIFMTGTNIGMLLYSSAIAWHFIYKDFADKKSRD